MRSAPTARVYRAATPALLVLLLTGCTALRGPAAEPTVPAPHGSGVELVVGVHANGPAPALTGRALAAVRTAIDQEQSIGVVVVDGRPRELQRALPMSVTGAAGVQRADADRRNEAALVALVHGGRATAAGIDLFSALTTAAAASRRAGTPVQRLVVLDSGLNDRGPLDLSEPGATEATPSLVAARLIRTGELRDDTFAGLTVDFTGLGTAVAAPQPTLPATQVRAVRAIYTAVVRAGGGSVVLRDDRLSGGAAAAATSPSGVVRPADGRIALGGSSAFGDGSSIGFRAGTASFRDGAAARALLRPLAAWLSSGSGHRATVIGRTSSEGSASKAQDLALSTARAQAVRSALVQLGADASLITARGEGYVADPPDRVLGVLDPAKAALNRVVRITTVA